MGSLTRLHAELLSLLRQHSRFCDHRQLVLLARMVTGLLLSQTVYFDHWKTVLALGRCDQRWLSNLRIDGQALYGPLQRGHALGRGPRQSDPAPVDHDREHPSACVSAEVVIALLERTDRLLREFGAITLLADRGFPSAELLGWFDGKLRWRYVMRLRPGTWIHGTAALMGCEVRRLRLSRVYCRGFRDVRLWGGSSQRTSLLLAFSTGLPVEEPWYLVSNADSALDLVWTYGQRFCCEQRFRDQKSGNFQLESSGLRDPARIDLLLLLLPLLVAIAVLVSSLQGFTVSLAGQPRCVDPDWQRGLSFVRIGLQWLRQQVINGHHTLLAWQPIPLRQLEHCIPSFAMQRRQKLPWFTRIELPPCPRQTALLTVA